MEGVAVEYIRPRDDTEVASTLASTLLMDDAREKMSRSQVSCYRCEPLKKVMSWKPDPPTLELSFDRDYLYFIVKHVYEISNSSSPLQQCL